MGAVLVAIALLLPSDAPNQGKLIDQHTKNLRADE
jgi:hypothetical protein